ncbi:MAG: aspartyl protease family protein [Nitrososphaerales archaeon]
MGVFKVGARVWNPSDHTKGMMVEFVVDTGSTYTVLPTNVLEKLSVSSIRSIRLRLADNRVLEKPLGEVGIEVEGYTSSATPVIFGEEGIYLLGSVTMEQLGLAPDPIEKRLKPIEVFLMKLD